MLLHLRDLLLRPSLPNPTGFTFPCCLFRYLTMSKPGHPQRNILSHELCTPIWLHNTLRWRWWESNPRPQCLYYKGITTILTLYIIYNKKSRKTRLSGFLMLVTIRNHVYKLNSLCVIDYHHTACHSVHRFDLS